MIYQYVDEIVTDNIFLKLSELCEKLDIYLKIEGLNPAGSIKLKTAVSLVDDAEQSMKLRPNGRVIESSSGNLGVAIATVCAVRGYKFTCVVDPNSSKQLIDTITCLGAKVVCINKRDFNGGFLGSRIAYIENQLKEDPGLVWLNQYANPANPAAHSLHTATSILKEFPQVDYLFVGAGTTGTLMGCVNKFKEVSPSTVIVAVDAIGSVTFGQRAKTRHIPGLGTSRRPEIFSPSLIDETVFVKELDTVTECHLLVSRYGLMAGGSTGTILAGVKQFADRIPDKSTVVAISPDLGGAYLNSVYSNDWVKSKFGEKRLAA